MKNDIRTFALVACLGLSALALQGCVLPVDHHRLHAPHPVGHAWVHYPYEDVYFCTRHGDYWVYEAGDWRKRDRVEVELTSYVRLSTRTALPFHSTHAWIYYDEPGAYYCTSHHHAWIHHDGRWAYRVSWSPGATVGVRLKLGTGRPYLHHSAKLRLPAAKARGPRSVHAGHPRGERGRGRLPSRPSDNRPPERASPRHASPNLGGAPRARGSKDSSPAKRGKSKRRGPK